MSAAPQRHMHPKAVPNRFRFHATPLPRGSSEVPAKLCFSSEVLDLGPRKAIRGKNKEVDSSFRTHCKLGDVMVVYLSSRSAAEKSSRYGRLPSHGRSKQ